MKGLQVKSNGERYMVEQDVQPYLDAAKRSRDIVSQTGGSKSHRPFAIIPDIVAIDILNNYGLNLHASEFMTNPEDVAKLKRIIKSEYPYLLTS